MSSQLRTPATRDVVAGWTALRRRPFAVDALAVFLLAALLRMALVVFSTGGVGGDYTYDPGVYYAAADALIHGRMPYSHFILLHPPGLMLVLTPFAALGRLTTDHTGFVVASFTTNVLAAVNAVLVMVVARRLGFGRSAALVGGVFYAVWYGAIFAELTVRLEPLGMFAFLGALVVLADERRLTPHRLVLAGLRLGAAASIKIWWAVPALLVIGWQLWGREHRSRAGWLALGTALAAVAVNGVFFVHAPGAMWRMVVTDQLGRHDQTNPLERIREITTLTAAFPHAGPPLEVLVSGAVLVLVLGAGYSAWLVPRGRPIVVLAAAQLLVLAMSPTYFSYYAGYLAGSFALTMAAATHSRQLGRAPRIGWTGAGCAALAALLTLVVFTRPLTAIGRVPTQLRPVAARAHCLISDSPMTLIDLNVLSRNLANGCPNWVDVSGRTYDTDKPPGRHQGRHVNPLWQRDVLRYLLSGDAMIANRADTGLSHASKVTIAGLPVLGHAPGWTIHAVPPGLRR